MTGKRILCAMAVLSIGNGMAVAQTSPGDQMPGISKVTKTAAATQVRPALYYTQLQITTSPFAVPSDSNGKKRLGRALLQSLGLQRETRSIIVSAVVSTNLAAYPEYPLLVYKFDDESRLLDVGRIGTLTLPLQRIEPAEPIRVKFTYRYSRQVTVDVGAAGEAIQGLIPGTTLVSAASQPFINKVTSLASKVFSLAASQATSSQLAEEMSPYGDQLAKTMIVDLAKPDGSPFGRIDLKLLATPTIQRAATLASSASAADLKLQQGEGATTLQLEIGGVSRNLITEIKGVPEFVRLSKERTPEAAREFCSVSREKLASTFRLTMMDRSLVMHQALFDTDPVLTRGAWYATCFDAQETEALTLASASLAKPAHVVVVTPDPAGMIPKPVKDAIGCLMTGQTGPYCTRHAPNPRQILLDALADQVRIGQMDYTGLVDVATLDPVTRLIPKTALADRLAGRATSFRCFSLGLPIGVENDTKAYNVLATIADGKITGLQTVALPLDALQCT